MPKQIYQLKITLQDIEPPIWRRILIPSTYDFWQLHCAIQDAFGWTDSHLHMFTYTYDTGQPPIKIGIPIESEFDDEEILFAGWLVKLQDYIADKSSKFEYTYDFGDNWRHHVELEEILPYEKGSKYPKCIAGERNGPPEDCGGPPGYEGLLNTLFDPIDPEHKNAATWADSMKGGKFEPEEFDPLKVKFTKPGWRLKKLFDD